MTVFDLLKNNLIGKTVYTKGNIPFVVEAVFHYQESLSNKVDKFAQKFMRLDEMPFSLNGIKLVGTDKNGELQELIATDSYLTNLFFFEP